MESKGAASEVALRPLRILLIEDDPDVGETLRRSLERAGMQVCWAATGAEAASQKSTFRPDVVLVDLELPDISGIELIRWLVEQRDCGVIVVSGAGDDTDRIVGLELGADDCVAKPPNLRELIARIRAVHRRAAPLERPAPQRINLASGLQVDLARRSVHTSDGLRVALTSAEYSAFETLYRARGKVVSRDGLAQAALHRPWRPDDRSVDQLILSLRQKIGSDTSGQRLIESIRGSGYLLRL